VDYRPSAAVAAGLWFRGWIAESEQSQAVARLSEPVAYEPGRFFLRELPCLLSVLELGPRPNIVVIDGYVTLGGKPGLGAHLHSVVGGIVIGVAKTRFKGASEAVEVVRGQSRRPLYVTAAGCGADQAALWIAAMHGPNRIPTLLKKVDSLSRAGD